MWYINIHRKNTRSWKRKEWSMRCNGEKKQKKKNEKEPKQKRRKDVQAPKSSTQVPMVGVCVC